eukprot:CAMPEP_0178909844 /NCGR_PEP_ID=MMETSP0786-20121207/8764_1 /TAXON_ID=186022 /ORGANISM="Thalassionema frauenfeldii, Strain CCMP 1798" /LENGTH=336 /DNA_ID=CAMNT_0020582023 /DNA_START=50 /DNA_END=1060 /DNA_ORIENTATION=+
MSDPLNVISNPPTTIVKVQGTSRNEVNGQLGIALQYNADRGRYTIHMVQSQTSMALKPENLIKASTMETYQAQFQQLTKDPRIRQQFMQYYNQAQSMLGMKPEYAAGVILVGLILVMYFVGFSKTLMALSMMLLILVIIGPDLFIERQPWNVVMSNFPRRCRESIETSLPAARGKLSNHVAAGIVVFMLAMSVKILLTSPASAAKPQAAFSTASASAARIEDAYKLGFEDAKNGAEYGTSLPTSKTAASSSDDDFMDDEIPYDYTNIPSPTAKSSSFGFSQIMSLFYLYRTATQLGNDPAGGNFSLQRLMANLRGMEIWQMGILGFSLYNLVRSFI